MSEPIIEQIAIWLKEALAEITEANGYQQTLAVKRPEDTYIDEQAIENLTTIIVQGDSEPDGEGTMEELFWLQQFDISTFFLAQRDAALSVDTRINRVAADIHKRLGLELSDIVTNNGTLCSGLAYRFVFLPIEIGIVESLAATVLNVPIGVAYAVKRTNPYEQIS